MKIKSVAGVTCAVKNLSKTAAFYAALGFQIKTRAANHITAYSNWFWIDFLALGRDERAAATNGAGDNAAGILLYLSVDNVDRFHAYVISKRMKPLSKPLDKPWGNREFVLRDPDGYNLVIFKRK